MQIVFLGEAGTDGGGLKREFWRLLGKDIQTGLLEGVSEACVLRHDAVGLKVS